MSAIIIGITGLARSGKDTVAQYIAQKYNFKLFTMSDTLKSECMKRSMGITKDNLSIVGDMMRNEFGNDIVAVRTLEKASDFPKSIITGVRSPMEVDLFRKSAKNFILLAVTAQSSRRFLRRTEKDPATEKDFFARDSRDIENKGLGKVIEMADSVIENDSSVEILHKRLDSFITRLNL